ncbi:hypothetical protein [Nocardioides currus]|uniref:Uncharacterized protein n=1 Tax=Nocardioides currus TaxID=2133958 RepID=A0A2R7YRP3_9ACTN|nr:hypothetical protein [Nocardioides currus]PUA79021.1 hypothetical protein C7S10_21340 [Nocardioides currus]
MTRTKLIGLVAAAIVVIGAVVVAVVWTQGDSAEAREAGSCEGASFVLESEREDNATEVSFEVQASEPGQAWDVRIAQGDQVLVEGTRTTDEDAEIDVDAYLAEGAAGDVTATASFEGQTCTATIPAS